MPPARPIPMGSGTAHMSMTSISSVWRGLFITGTSVFDLCRCMWGARVHGIIAMSTTSSFLRCPTHMIPFPILAAVDKPGKRRAPASERDPRAARRARRARGWARPASRRGRAPAPPPHVPVTWDRSTHQMFLLHLSRGRHDRSQPTNTFSLSLSP